jgi:hypothetical protein
MLQDIVADIASKNGAHIQKEITHLFPHYTRKQVDIIIIRDNFQTLVNIVIIDPTHTDLV